MVYIKSGIILLVAYWLNGVPEVNTQIIRGTWSAWTSWTSCKGSCGNGYMHRTRYCYGDRRYCQGDRRQQTNCHPSNCDGGGHGGHDRFDDYGTWQSWDSWGPCSRTCGRGEAWRGRGCSRFRCDGDRRERKECNTHACPDPFRRNNPYKWSGWSSWSHCSRTCGEGWKERRRHCGGYGRPCHGDSYQKERCYQTDCYKQRHWKCSSSKPRGCYYGQRKWYWDNYKRDCLPFNFNHRCQDKNVWFSYEDECRQACAGSAPPLPRPDQFRWGVWGAWDPPVCGRCGDRQRRQRSCLSGRCLGDSFEERTCDSNCFTDPPRPDLFRWGVWGAWDPPVCGRCGDSQRRQRSCLSGQCPGDSFQQRPCDSNCFSEWGSWSDCTFDSGEGRCVQRRDRDCRGNCQGSPPFDTRGCTCDPGPPQGEWSDWGPWGECIPDPADNNNCFERRDRVCRREPCQGNPRERRTCTCDPGPVPPTPTWGPWRPWGPCGSDCRRQRSRVCTGGQPADCPGAAEEEEECTDGDCRNPPTTDNWRQWTAWTACNPTCGRGLSLRRRDCRDTSPQRQGCLGLNLERRPCNGVPCRK